MSTEGFLGSGYVMSLVLQVKVSRAPVSEGQAIY